jgi:hypothetical protein
MRNNIINSFANVIRRFSADVSMQRINAPQMWHVQMCAGTSGSGSHDYQNGNVGILSAKCPADVDFITSKSATCWSSSRLSTTLTDSAVSLGLGRYLPRLERTGLEVFANTPTLNRGS